MSTRLSLRSSKNPEVVDLLASSDEEEEDKKPPARKRQSSTRDETVISLLFDSDVEDDGSPAKKVRSTYASSFNNSQVDSDAEFARKLQEEEANLASSSSNRRKKPTLDYDSDAEFARKLQQEEENRQQLEEERAQKDAAMAAELHGEEEKERDKRKQQELDSMKLSTPGRAVLLAEKVITLLNDHEKDGIEPVGKDDAVYLAEKMMNLQDVFETEGRPTHICIGYHYTHSTHLESIRQDGLLTVEDRIAAKNKNIRNSAFFGNGIYSANNPLGFKNYGEIGLIMAVLKGKEEHVGRKSKPKVNPDTDSVIGNKLGDYPMYDEIILKKSAQVLPLIKFDTSKVITPAFADTLWSIHGQLQKVLDEFFNNSVRTETVRVQDTTQRDEIPVPNPFPKSVAKAAPGVTSPANIPTPPKPRTRSSRRSRSSIDQTAALAATATAPSTSAFGVALSTSSSGLRSVMGSAASQSAGGAAFSAAPTASSATLFTAPYATAPSTAAAGVAPFSSASGGMVGFGLPPFGSTGGPPFGSSGAPPFGSTGAPPFGSTGAPPFGSAPFVFPSSSHQLLPGPAGISGPSSVLHAPTATALSSSLRRPRSSSRASKSSRRGIPSGPTAVAMAGVIPPAVVTAGGTAKSRSLSGSTIVYTAPETLVGPSDVNFKIVAAGIGDCSICLSALADGSQVVQLARCPHQFHQQCIQDALKHNTKCPDCRVPITELQGKGPSGAMTITASNSDVSGFPGQGSIMISYRLKSGTQKAYHENPGVPYSGTSRIGYLPNNAEGQALLKRLKYAFARGLTFSIGTSMTTHAPNVITWGSVHHKTSPVGGVAAHGFPDPNYFINANSELDGLGVPPAHQL